MARSRVTTDGELLEALPEGRWFHTLRRRLLAWFRQHGRDLPWRRTRDPYAVWVSEVMLQQTQVATVLRYYERFLKRFPTVRALAKADEQAVLRAWEGLGYYRRARQLHQAARLVVDQHAGRVPQEIDALCALPGIGTYTAGAILSLALDRRTPILEANTVRLWSRLLDCPDEVNSTRARRLLWAAAEAILPRRDPGPVNLALMDLGSKVCTPKGPRCDRCPAFALCGARAAGRQAELPRTRARPQVSALSEAAVVLHHAGRVLLLQRPDEGRWAGLWDFPRFELPDGPAGDGWAQLSIRLRRCLGVETASGRHLTTLRYTVTRFRVTLECYEARMRKRPGEQLAARTSRWVRVAELAEYALSAAARRLARLLGA